MKYEVRLDPKEFTYEMYSYCIAHKIYFYRKEGIIFFDTSEETIIFKLKFGL